MRAAAAGPRTITLGRLGSFIKVAASNLPASDGPFSPLWQHTVDCRAPDPGPFQARIRPPARIRPGSGHMPGSGPPFRGPEQRPGSGAQNRGPDPGPGTEARICQIHSLNGIACVKASHTSLT